MPTLLRTTVGALAVVSGIFGCGESEDSGSGTPTTGTLDGTSTSTGVTGTTGAPAGCLSATVEDGSLNLVVAPANNYTFDSNVTLDVLRVAPNTPFNFDWSALLPEQIDPYLDPMTFPPESNVYAVPIASLHYEGTWNVNHGHHVLPNGNFLFFNNGAAVRQSPVLELELTEPEVTVVWSYASDYASGTLGDVQRLPNGNTLITYSNAGVIQEVDRDQRLVQQFSTASLGYVEHRPTLYGPPPR